MTLYEVYQLVTHINRTVFAAQQDPVLSPGVTKQEEEFCLAWTLVDEFVKLCHDLLIKHISNQRDGDTVYGLLLDTLQKLDILHFQV